MFLAMDTTRARDTRQGKDRRLFLCSARVIGTFTVSVKTSSTHRPLSAPTTPDILSSTTFSFSHVTHTTHTQQDKMLGAHRFPFFIPADKKLR